jgi:hypothetical protein
VEEEMNTMSKTLSLSLKEQLMGRQAAIFDKLEQLEEVEESEANGYFQYEQRVFMKPADPKVVVPPLFPRAS